MALDYYIKDIPEDAVFFLKGLVSDDGKIICLEKTAEVLSKYALNDKRCDDKLTESEIKSLLEESIKECKTMSLEGFLRFRLWKKRKDKHSLAKKETLSYEEENFIIREFLNSLEYGLDSVWIYGYRVFDDALNDITMTDKELGTPHGAEISDALRLMCSLFVLCPKKIHIRIKPDLDTMIEIERLFSPNIIY